ncbi:hypothetical protein [Actinospongicola halichondriae]|uniref:hypothetical protein n=1 Tax=Actinospongicola halichondriae TaxID=3236844 RepID=UPI003D522644
MSPRRVAFWMLATAGVAVGHIAGYALAHPDVAAREAALGGHAYLPAAAATAIPVGVLAALWWAVRTARTLGLAGSLDWRRLAAAQVAVFAVQEVGERLVGGEGLSAVLDEPGVWLGLVAQVAVAFLTIRGIDLVRRAVRLVIAGRPVTTQLPRLASVVHPVIAPRPVTATVAVGLRAPPSFGSAR